MTLHAQAADQAPARVHPATGTAGPAAHHRGDIDGMRAFAIAVVVAFHASIPMFDGGFIGVDVFFVISGFLITSVLLRELDEYGTIRLGRFWARRIRRLLPASSIVILATLAGAVVFLSPIGWRVAGRGGTWAAAYAQNFFLAVEEANYFAAETKSPFVHFWSLAVEEQFYVIWPLLLLGLSTLAPRFGGRRFLTASLGALAAASLVHSVQLTNSGSTWAYYSPLSRGWEFAAGGLLALATPTVAKHMTARWAQACTLAGLALLAYSLSTLDAFTPFPGWRALAPVLGTVLLIAANNAPTTIAGRLLALAPVQWLGRMSYGWYLWHFPFLIIVDQYSETFGPVRRLVTVALSLGAAAISYHLVENPVRFSAGLSARNGRNYALAGGLLAVSVLASAVAVSAADRRLDSPKFAELTTAADDLEGLSERGCPEGADIEALSTTCVWGDPAGDRTLLVLGDSHADMWVPALDQIGAASGIKIQVRIVVACLALDGGGGLVTRSLCRDVQAGQLEVIDAVEPDAVMLAHWAVSFEGSSESQWTSSVRSFGEALADRDVSLLLVHGTPTLSFNPIDCIGIRDEASCAPSAGAAAGAAVHQRKLLVDALEGIPFASFDPVGVLCDDETCALRLDGSLVYRDSSHITATASRAFAQYLEPPVLEAVGLS